MKSLAPIFRLVTLLALPLSAHADVLDRPTDVLGRVIQVGSDQRASRPPVVSALSIQPGGRLLAIGGDDHVVRLWDLATEKLVHELQGHRDWIRDADFSPDGRYLATAGNDGRILIWDVETGTRRASLDDFQKAIAKLAYSQDGRRLAVAGFDQRMHVYEVDEQELNHPNNCPCSHLRGPCSDMRAVAFSPSGAYLAAGGRNGRVRIWSTSELREQRDFAAHSRRVRALAFSADGTQLVTSGEDRMIRAWDVASGRQVFELASPSAKVMCMAICPSHMLATAGSDNTVRLWDMKEKSCLHVLEGHTGSIAALVCVGNVLVSGSFDTTVRLWDLREICGSEQRALVPGASHGSLR